MRLVNDSHDPSTDTVTRTVRYTRHEKCPYRCGYEGTTADVEEHLVAVARINDEKHQ